jgi:hypothetical protein
MGSNKVTYTVQDSAMWQLHLDVTGAPDTSHPEHPGGSLRPVGVSLGIGVTDGVWSVSAVNVFGQKVKDGKVVTKRNYPLPFLDPLGEDSEAPEWLREVCQDWVDKANGMGAAPVEQPREVKERSPQRASFETALNVLLIKENLDGAEWALQQILDEAEILDGGPGLGDTAVAEYLRTLVEKVSGGLDKRTAELATREN